MTVHQMPRCDLARASAFATQGVTLKYPGVSWSGVRSEDGMVVFAIHAADVRFADWGASSILWSPQTAAAQATPRAGSEERLEHCRLALRHGVAEGFLVRGSETLFFQPEVLALRVVSVGERYWARWGAVARAHAPRNRAWLDEACA